jgi:hypothetical protein
MIAEHAKSGVRHSYTPGGVICIGRARGGGGRAEEKGGVGREGREGRKRKEGRGEIGKRKEERVHIVSVGCSPIVCTSVFVCTSTNL